MNLSFSAARQLGLLVGQRQDGRAAPGPPPVGGGCTVACSVERAVEFVARAAAPHHEDAVMPGIVALALDGEPLDREPDLLVGVGDELLQERELLLELRVLGR